MQTNISKNYSQQLKDSFYESYVNGLDLWSLDNGLTDVAFMLAKHLNDSSSHSILDIGTGTGRHCEIFASKGMNFTGIDLYSSENWVDFKVKYEELVRFEHSSFQDWEIDDKYTAVLDNGCFHHQEPDEYLLYLKKIYQMLQPSGVLMLGLYTPNDENEESRLNRMKSGKLRQFFNVNHISQLLVEAKFSVTLTKKIRVEDRDRYYLAVLATRN